MADTDNKESKKPPAADVDEDWEGEEGEKSTSSARSTSDPDDDDDEDEEDETSQPKAALVSTKPAPANKGAVSRAASRAAEAHDHGLAHITPVKLLIGVFGVLTVLTVMTVAVTAIDLGSEGNFIIAMIIATIKAGLVMAFFMHLVWDKKFNLTVFLSAFLFVLLFLSLALTDRNEYQAAIDHFEQANPAAPAKEPAAAPAH